MLPYLVVFAIFAVAAFSAGSRPHGEYRQSLLISSFVLVIFIGLRLRVGGDWQNYLSLLEEVRYVDLWSALSGMRGSDPAYVFINWLAAQAGAGIWVVNLICATIFVWGLMRLCREQSNPPLAILVAIPYLVTVVAMGYTRQSAALGLIMYAIAQIRRRANIKIVVSLVLAASFHKSAVTVIPFFGIAAAGGAALNLILFALVSYLGFALLLAGSVNQLIENYVQSGYSSSGALVRVLMNVVPAVLYLGFSRRFGFENKQKLFWIGLSVASLAALAALAIYPSSTAVDRLALFFIPLQVVVLSRIPSIFSSEGRQNMILVTLVVLYSLAVDLVWLNFGAFSSAWIPYRNYLWS